MQIYSVDKPLSFNIIRHYKKSNPWGKIALLVMIASFIGIIIIDYRRSHDSDTLLYALLFLFITSTFIYSYFTFYRRNFYFSGNITFSGDNMIIDDEGNKTHYAKQQLANIRLHMNLLEHTPHLFMFPKVSKRITKSSPADGSGNFFMFDFNGNTLSFELYMKDKAQLHLLSAIAKEWNANINLP